MLKQQINDGCPYDQIEPQQLRFQTPIYQTPAHPNNVYMHSASHAVMQVQNHGRHWKQENSSATLRSRLLREFHINKDRKWALKVRGWSVHVSAFIRQQLFQDLFGYHNYALEFSSDQQGSRFIQQELRTATDEEKQMFLDRIIPDSALYLMNNPFGNHVGP